MTVTFADALLVVGFLTAITGLWLAAGAGLALAVGGSLLMLVGARMYGKA